MILTSVQQTSATSVSVSQENIVILNSATSSPESTIAPELGRVTTSSQFEAGESSVLKPMPTQLGGTTTSESESDTTEESNLKTDAAAAAPAIPVYVWPIAIIAIVAVVIAIVLAIVIFWKTKKSK